MDIFDHLYHKLQERILNLNESLSNNSAKDYAEYRELCGVIRGLRSAQMEVQDLASRTKEIEDE
jgi:predicted transport protein